MNYQILFSKIEIIFFFFFSTRLKIKGQAVKTEWKHDV